MTQFDYIKDFTRFGLENDQEKLRESLLDMINHSPKRKKNNLDIHVQTFLKEANHYLSTGESVKTGSGIPFDAPDSKDVYDLILDRATLDYRLFLP